MTVDLAHRDEMLQRQWEAGRAAWPTLPLPQESFTAHLQVHLAAEREPESYLKMLKAADLYLACACARGLPEALAAFEQQYLRQLPRYLSRIALSAAMVQDVQQLVSIRLFVSEAGSPARIASYTGRGLLASWLRTLAVRTALNLKEKKDEHLAGAPAEDVADRVFAVAQDPELEFLKARYTGEVRAAIRAAVQSLPAEQRTVLHLYLVGGLTTTRLGTVFQVSHATVSRWLRDAREAILTRTQALLRQKLGTNTEEFHSLVRMIRSQLDLSLAGILGAPEAPQPQR